MGKGPSKSFSKQIINYNEQEVALGKQNAKTACPMEKLEFKLFSNPTTSLSRESCN